MKDTGWNDGYVVETDYPLNYFRVLSLNRARWSLLIAGYGGLENPTTACELGFGYGLSINLHAAANPHVAQWGTDFNATQAAFARGLAEASGSGARLFDQSFAEFLERPDLPEFDFIGLHGVWSWVSPDARKTLVEFLRRRLKPGGVAYVSYNAMPGWAPFMPVREILLEHARSQGRPGEGVLRHIGEAVQFTGRMLAALPLYARANPGVQNFFNGIKDNEANYLAHEYLNSHWRPYYFSEISRELTEAKLSFAAPAEQLDHVDPIHLTPEAQDFLSQIPEPTLRETTRDFFVNSQFRRDLWVKGPTRLSQQERAERLRATRVALVVSHRRIPLKVKGALGERELLDTAYKPVLEALAANGYAPKLVGDLEQTLKAAGPQFALLHLVQILTTLAGMGCVEFVHASDATIEAARGPCARLNAALDERVRLSREIPNLASPLTDGGIGMTHVLNVLRIALSQGAQEPEAMARHAWDTLSRQGRTVLKAGKPLGTPEENLAELTRQARDLLTECLPIWRMLGIA